MIKLSKKKSEKLLSKILKRGLSLSVAAVIGATLISATDNISYASDLRARADINPTSASTNVSNFANGVTVVNIANPNNGISYNTYDRFNLEYEDSAILNNSMKSGQSELGGTIAANKNLKNEASVIVNEIIGPMSKLSGNLEIFGNKVDLVFANENGILVDGGYFINASSLTLTNGKILNPGDKFNIDVKDNDSKVAIGEFGLSTDADTLNLLGSNIDIQGPINEEESTRSDINILAGANKFEHNGNSLVMTNRDSTSKNVKPISMSEYGSMYGNNIYILSNNEQSKTELKGLVHADNNLKIASKGNIEVTNLDAKNVSLNAANSVVNTGKIKAQNDVEVNAPKLINKSTLSGDVRTDITNDVAEQNNRIRDYIYYYDFVIKEKKGVKYASDLKLNKASIEAGKNINFNHRSESGTFINEGGDLSAGKDINVKGDFISNTPVKSVKITDALSQIDVDTHWERRSLVDGRWFSDGESTETRSMLKTLLKIAHTNDDWASIHYYEALKQIKDPDMVLLLNGLLGSDWKTRTKIKRPLDWNMDAAINFGANSKENITAGNAFKVVGSNVNIGNSSSIVNTVNKVEDNEFSSITSDIDKNINQASFNAKNIAIKADNININQANVSAKDKLALKSTGNISTKGSYFTGDSAIISADGDIVMSSKLGIDDSGNQYVSGESGIKTSSGTSIKAHDLSLYGTDLNATNGALKIDANNILGHDVNIVKSNYILDRKDPYWLGFDSYKNNKELTAQILPVISKLEAKDVQINSQNNLDLKGSVIAGVDDSSLVKLQAGGDVNISNSDVIRYRKYSSDMRGKWNNDKYSFLKLQNVLDKKVAVLPSNLTSGGNIDIDARNMQVIGSNVIAGKDLSMRIKHNLDILARMNSEQEDLFNLDWDIASLHLSTDNTNSNKVAHSNVKAKSGLSILVNGDMTTESARLAGDKVDISIGGNYDNTAKQNTTDKYSNKLDAGFNATGKIALAGMGASGSVNTATGGTSHAVSGPKGILELKNDFKDATITGGVGMELHYSDSKKHSTETVNSAIVGTKDNVDINVGGNAEIGNLNLVSSKDINLNATSISTHNLENKSTESANTVNLAFNVSVSAGNPTISKVNDLLNKVSVVKDKVTKRDIVATIDTVEKIKDGAVDLYKNLPKAIVEDDIVRLREAYKAGIDYKHSYDSNTSTNVNNVIAKGNVNLNAHDGSLELNSSKVKGENVNIAASEGIHIGSTSSDKVHNEDGFSVNAQVNRDYAVNPKDGIKGTITVAPNIKYQGSTSLEHEKNTSTIEGTNVSYKTPNVEKDTKESYTYKDGRHLGVGGNLTIGLSSNHLVVAEGSFTGDAGYNYDVSKKFVNPLNGKEVELGTSGGLNVAGSINSDGTGGKVSVNTTDTGLSVNKHKVVIVPGKELISREFENGQLKPVAEKEKKDPKVVIQSDINNISLNVNGEKYLEVPYNDVLNNVVPEVFDADTQWLIDMGLLTPVPEKDTPKPAENKVEKTKSVEENNDEIANYTQADLDEDTRMLVEMGLLTLE